MGRQQYARTAAIKRTDATKREVFGEVGLPLPRLSPGQVITRSQYEAWKAEGRLHYDDGAFLVEDLVELAHRFLRHSRDIDQEHDRKPGLGDPIESYIALDDAGGFRKDAWVLGTYVSDDTAWSKAEVGGYNAYSVSMLAVPEVVEIIVEDDVASADGTKQIERVKVTYFTDPWPEAVTLTDHPATGIPWQVVRCTEPGKGTCSGTCEHKCRTCVSRTTPPAPPAPKEPAMKEGVLRRILRSLAPAAKEEGLDIEALLVERVADFTTAWAAKKASEDLYSAWYALTDVLYQIKSDEDVPDKAAAMKVAVQQFAAFLETQVALMAVARTEGAATTPALKVVPVERALPGMLDEIVERVGKKFSAKSEKELRACVDDAKKVAERLQELLDTAETEDRTKGAEPATRTEEEPMDPKTQELLDKLAADNAALVERIAKQEKPAEPAPAAPAQDPEAAKQNEALRTANAELAARLESLEKARPAPTARTDDQVHADREAKVAAEAKTFFVVK